MDFLRKYFNGQLTPQEEVQVQDWLVEHAEDPQVQDALLTIMSEMQEDDAARSSEAYVNVCRRLGLNRRSRLEKMGYRVIGIVACIMLPLLGAFIYDRLSVPEQADWLEIKVPYGQTEELVLADGTRLHLNAALHILPSFWVLNAEYL